MTAAVKALRERGTLDPTAPLRIVIVPDRAGAALSAVQGRVFSIAVNVH